MDITNNTAFCIIDGQARLMYTNDAFQLLFGFSQSELMGKDLYSFIQNTDQKKICKILNNGVEAGEEYSFNIQALTKDGSIVQCETSSTLLYNTNAEDKQAIVHFRESEPRPHYGQNSTEAEHKFRTLFNHTYDAIFLMKNDTFIDCNPRTEVMFGCSREELLRKTPSDFSPDVQPDGRPSKEKSAEKIAKALRGIPQSFEWTHCRKDGVKFDVEVSLNRIEIDDEVMVQAIVRDITKRKDTEAELRYRVDFEKFIASISTNFINLTPVEIDTGIRNALEDVGMFANVDRSFIFLLNEKADAYTISYEWCNTGIGSLNDRQLTLHVDTIQWWHGKLSRFEHIRIADVSNLPAMAKGEKKLLQSIGVQSVLCVPLRIGKSLIGFIGFDSVTGKKHWSIESVNLLRIISEIIANSIERKRRDEELRRLAEQRKHLLEVSTSVLATLNLDEVIRQTLNVLKEIIQFDECGIHLLDREKHILQPHIIVDRAGNPIESNKSIVPVGKGIIGSVVQTGISEIVNEAQNDVRSYYPEGKHFTQEHIICIPMQTKKNILGTFTVIRHDNTPFTTEEFEMVQLFIGYATVAMENAQLYQTVHHQHSITSALLQTALSIVEQKDVKKVMALIAEQAVKITRVNRCAVFMWNDVMEQFEPTVVITPNKERMPSFEKLNVKPGDALVIERLKQSKAPVIINETCVDGLLPDKLIKAFGIKSMLVIPIFKGGVLLGGMTLDDTNEARRFTGEDMTAAIGIANQAAVAFENARLFEQIKASEERYRSLFEYSIDGVFTSTEEGQIIDINPAGIEMLGYDSKEEMQHVNVGTEIYHDPRRREEYKNILREHKYVKDFEAVLRRKDGKTITCLITSTIFLDEETGTIYYRGFMRDVTDKKILEDKLRQTQKMESLGQLASGIAHDFNNVLGIVQISLSALKSRLRDSDNGIGKYVDMGENAVMRGADVARRLLTFSQSHEVRLRSLIIPEVVKDLVNVLKHTIEKNISIETEIQSDLSAALGDHGQVYQMLLNLCLNARDAIMDTKAGTSGGYIKITAEEVAGYNLPGKITPKPGKRYLKLSIEDNGGGMPSYVREKIFDPFYTTKEKGKGTGLGLSVVYGIVQSHSGYIDIETEVGRGTVFSIFLPVFSGGEDIVQTIESEPIAGGNEHILIVEDEDTLRLLMDEILQSKGYRVTAVPDGITALDVFRKRHRDFDAVILDMGLPKLPGQALFLKMRQISPDSKVILASGYVEEELKSNLFELGAKAFVQKPYKAHAILRTVRNVLDECYQETIN